MFIFLEEPKFLIHFLNTEIDDNLIILNKKMNTFFNSNIYMDIGIIIIYLGLGGILLNRNNIIISIICIEIVFYGINYYLLTSALIIQDLEGLVVSFFVLTVAAAESAVALGILMVYFKIFKNILL